MLLISIARIPAVSPPHPRIPTIHEALSHSTILHSLAHLSALPPAPLPLYTLIPALPRITHHAFRHPAFLHPSPIFLHLFARDPGPLVSPTLSLPFLFGLALRTSSRPLRYDPFPLQLIDDICIRTVLGSAAQISVIVADCLLACLLLFLLAVYEYLVFSV